MKKIISVIVILLLMGGVIASYFVFGHFSEGYRSGVVMKMSKKGILFKTYEGLLNTGGLELQAPGEVPSSIWAFTVPKRDKEVLELIDEAVDSGYRVKLYYKEKYFLIRPLGDTKYFVYSVERVGF